jgi:hypothetical protein
VSTNAHAVMSGTSRGDPSSAVGEANAKLIGAKKNRALTKRMPRSAMPRAISTPRRRSADAIGASVMAAIVQTSVWNAGGDDQIEVEGVARAPGVLPRAKPERRTIRVDSQNGCHHF